MAEQTLAMRTYEAMGAEKFKEFIVGLGGEQFDSLFGLCLIVDPKEKFDSRETYIEIVFDYPENEKVVNSCIVEDIGLFLLCRDRMHSEDSGDNTTLLKMGRKVLGVKDVAKLRAGSKYELYSEDLILEGVGVKVGARGWQETGISGNLDNYEVAEYLGEDHIKFYDENGKRIFNE